MDQTRGRRLRSALLRALVPVIVVLVAAAWVQRSKPDLARSHRLTLEHEFEAEDVTGEFGWAQYLATEERLFAELESRMVRNGEPADSVPAWSRYAAGGVNNPAGFPKNWNRSYELSASPAVGGALLLHGLTDSPYSLRTVAGILNSQGYRVLGLRLPGHGTVPSALLSAGVEDWRAAVRVAYRHLLSELGPDQRVLLVGYSNGAALALDLALDSIADPGLRVPERLVLLSPAIGITRAAALARAHHLLSWMPWFDKLGWKDIQPEYDPFKYNSFPDDAGHQTHVLTRSVRHRLARLGQSGDGPHLPPVLTFMSLADATVRAEAVVTDLYDHLDGPASELVVFDINRQAQTLGFFTSDPAESLRSLRDRPITPYRLTVITNVDRGSERVEEWTRPAGTDLPEITPLDLAWPRGVYSLSHVAIPFPPDDPIYGTDPDPGDRFGVQLGTLEPRGERGLLAVPADQITRLRSNPFFSYVEGRLKGAAH